MDVPSPTVTLRAGSATVEIAPALGGRLASLAVDGLELLVGRDDNPLGWGCYPMVPFAGRVRQGVLTSGGGRHQLPVNLAPHAIHGYGFGAPWRLVDPTEHEPASAPGADRSCELELRIDGPLPYRAVAHQRIVLLRDRLYMALALSSVEGAFPATIGWHPWFRRQLARGGAAELTFAARWRFERDDEGIPTGLLGERGDGPWDDCFTGLGPPPRLRWPGALVLDVEHDCDHLVIYDETRHAVCVEAQSGPPDGVNFAPDIVEPGRPLARHLQLRWA
ncbi:MAG: aldose epimerase [Acidimicrobiia bacterium]|nr:aldose epimerase [Acidimicrobiia bacterium]